MNVRKRFEAWAASPLRDYELGTIGGQYVSCMTCEAWAAWQEAERQMIERCAKVCDDLREERSRQHNNTGFNALHQCAEAIRALGEQQSSETEASK